MNYTIVKNTCFEFTEKKSRFIANLIYVENEEEAKSKLQEIRKRYFDARHNCFAYRILENEMIYERSSDDGEPSGTAGSPMLNILKKNNLCNILVVVTRYFGGVLLGTGGLVRSYSKATIGTIEKSEKKEIQVEVEMQVQLDYAHFRLFNYYCRKNNINIVDSSYSEDIIVNVKMSVLNKEKFEKDVTCKNIKIKSYKEVKNGSNK